MADDTSQRHGRDRSRVAGGQEHELRYFAQTHGLSIEQAQQLIAEHGNSREALEAAVQQMKG